MWSKWYLGLATLEAGEWFLLATLMLSSLLNIGYLLPISIRAFFGKPGNESSEGMKEAPLTCVFAMMVTSLACVLLFFFPEPWYRLASMAVF